MTKEIKIIIDLSKKLMVVFNINTFKKCINLYIINEYKLN